MDKYSQIPISYGQHHSWSVAGFAAGLAALLALCMLALSPARSYAQQSNDVPPSVPTVQVDISAVVSNSVIAYAVSAANPGDYPVWDLNLTIPIPQGATLLSAAPSNAAVVAFDGQAISFYTSTLGSHKQTGPQRFLISEPATSTSLVTTQAEATWKYVQTVMQESSLVQANTASGPITVALGRKQLVAADTTGEVPLDFLDLAAIDLQQESSNVRVDLRVGGVLGPSGDPSEYTLSIDADCNESTGRPKGKLGLEYRVRYRQVNGKADISAWRQSAEAQAAWLGIGSISVVSPAAGKLISWWIPSALLDNHQRFCWMVESRRKAEPGVYEELRDQLPNDLSEPALTEFGAWYLTELESGDWLTGDQFQPIGRVAEN